MWKPLNPSKWLIPRKREYVENEKNTVISEIVDQSLSQEKFKFAKSLSSLYPNAFTVCLTLSSKFNIFRDLIEIGVDTQAPINAISSETYSRMVMRPKLHLKNFLVFSYECSKPLKSFGAFTSRIIYKEKLVNAEF